MTEKTNTWLCGGVVTQRIANPYAIDIFPNYFSYIDSHWIGTNPVNRGGTWGLIGTSSPHVCRSKFHNLIALKGKGTAKEMVK